MVEFAIKTEEYGWNNENFGERKPSIESLDNSLPTKATGNVVIIKYCILFVISQCTYIVL